MTLEWKYAVAVDNNRSNLEDLRYSQGSVCRRKAYLLVDGQHVVDFNT